MGDRVPVSDTGKDTEMLAEAKRLLDDGTSNSLMGHQRKKWNDDRERLVRDIEERLRA